MGQGKGTYSAQVFRPVMEHPLITAFADGFTLIKYVNIIIIIIIIIFLFFFYIFLFFYFLFKIFIKTNESLNTIQYKLHKHK